MVPELTVEDAVARARQTEERRIEAIRLLVTAQQGVTTARQQGAERVAQAQREADEQVSAAEKENAQRYSEALAAGWSAADLRKIGFREPPKQTRTRRRGSGRRTQLADSNGSEPAEQSAPVGTADQSK